MIPRISVVLPSRGRPHLLEKMLASLYGTVRAAGQVEVVIRCDHDDPETISFVQSLRHPLLISGPRYRGYASLATFVNEAARLSHGELVLVVNDDAEFLTFAWDDLLMQAASEYKDGIFDLSVDTVLNNENFVFPCTSRRVVDLIGVHDERVIYNDIWLRDVMAHFGRAIKVPNVTVRHNWEGLTADQTNVLCKTVQTREYADLYSRCVSEGIAKVRAAVGATI